MLMPLFQTLCLHGHSQETNFPSHALWTVSVLQYCCEESELLSEIRHLFLATANTTFAGKEFFNQQHSKPKQEPETQSGVFV